MPAAIAREVLIQYYSPAAIDLHSDLHNLVFVYCYERNVRPRRPANPGCSRYAHTAAAAGRTAASTNHHRVPTLHMFSASTGGPGR